MHTSYQNSISFSLFMGLRVDPNGENAIPGYHFVSFSVLPANRFRADPKIFGFDRNAFYILLAGIWDHFRVLEPVWLLKI